MPTPIIIIIIIIVVVVVLVVLVVVVMMMMMMMMMVFGLMMIEPLHDTINHHIRSSHAVPRGFMGNS